MRTAAEMEYDRHRWQEARVWLRWHVTAYGRRSLWTHWLHRAIRALRVNV